MTRTTLLVAILALQPGAASAGIRTIYGSEQGVWTDHSAVYADITSLTDLGLGNLGLTLRIRATLTGSFDAAECPVLKTDLHYGPKVSAIRVPPRANARVIVILRRPRNVAGALLERYIVPSDIIKFMPNEAAILEVKDFEDPNVQQIISRLRELRAPADKKAGSKRGRS